ncbi:hypothetical protein D3C78_1425810 [compost metagenome]
MLKGFDIPRLPFAVFQRTQDLHAPRQTVTAWRTPAAGLAREKLFQVAHQRNHANLVVYCHRQCSTETAAGFTDALEVHRQIEVIGGQEVGARAAWLPGFETQTVTHATGVIFQNFTCGGTKRQLPNAWVFHPAGEAHQFGPGVVTFAGGDPLVPVNAVRQNGRHVTQGFYVVNAGRFAPYAG